MLPTVALLEQWFSLFNNRYFEGSLPLPRIVLSKSRQRLGAMICHRVRGWKGWRIADISIRISIYYDCDEHEYQTVLLHEMIHYYIAYHRLADRSAHGPLFRAHMQRINAQGWNITVSARTRSWQVRSGLDKPRTRLLLYMVSSRGQRFLSVVSPTYAQKLDRTIAKNASVIVQHRWYTSDDSRFARFPAVRTLRGRCLSETEWNALRPLLRPVSMTDVCVSTGNNT